VSHVAGVENALVVSADGDVVALHPIAEAISLVANLKAMISFSDDMSIF